MFSQRLSPGPVIRTGTGELRDPLLGNKIEGGTTNSAVRICIILVQYLKTNTEEYMMNKILNLPLNHLPHPNPGPVDP